MIPSIKAVHRNDEVLMRDGNIFTILSKKGGAKGRKPTASIVEIEKQDGNISEMTFGDFNRSALKKLTTEESLRIERLDTKGRLSVFSELVRLRAKIAEDNTQEEE